MNKAFVDFVIRDYSKPIGVATYKTSAILMKSECKFCKSVDFLNVVQYNAIEQCSRRVWYGQKRECKKSHYWSNDWIDWYSLWRGGADWWIRK